MSRIFKRKIFSNSGKLALIFSIFFAQLLPINQSAYGAGETSSTYQIPKSNSYTSKVRIKVPIRVSAGEPTMLSWQMFLNPNSSRVDIGTFKVCNLTSSIGKNVDYAFDSSPSGKSGGGADAYLVIKSAISTNLILDCSLDSIFSEGTLKLSRYILNSNDLDNLPANGEFEIKSGEIKVLIFNKKVGESLYFSFDSDKVGRCVLSSISDSANSNPHLVDWDERGIPKYTYFGGPDYRGAKVAPALKSLNTEATGVFMMTCMLAERETGIVTINGYRTDLKLLRPQPLQTETTPPAKCPVAKAPSNAPKISVAKNGLFIQYSENGFSDLPGCIDGFRVYATELNPYTKEVFQEHGSWSIPIADCKPPVKGLISCLISFEKDWLLKLKSQDASSNTMAINASAVNSQGESIFSQRVFLFEKDPNLIAVACASMQASFANNLISSPSNAFATQAKWGAAAGVAAGLITILITGGAAIPFVVGAGVAIVAASASKEVSARRSTDIDKNAAKKFIETYPVTALDLLILMKKSSNSDVRAMSETFQKAIQASDLIKIYRPLIGENNALTDFEVRKIIADEKLSRMKEVEASNFEKNGDKDLKSLFGKNSKFKGVLVKNASKISQGVDSFLVFKEQIQNNQSAENFILPNNCWFG